MTQRERIDIILYDLQMELVEHVVSTISEREKLLPLTGKRSVYSLIWNLQQPKYQQRISVSDFHVILDKLISRL